MPNCAHRMLVVERIPVEACVDAQEAVCVHGLCSVDILRSCRSCITPPAELVLSHALSYMTSAMSFRIPADQGSTGDVIVL